jgi:hypothetical protein
MIEAFVLVLVMLAISTVAALLMLMWFKIRKWEQKPMTSQEKTVLIFILRNLPDLRFGLILFTVVFLTTGFFLIGSDIEMWIFFVIVEIFLVIGVVFLQKIKKMIRNKLLLPQPELKPKSKFKKKYISFLKNKKLLLFIFGLVSALIFLIFNTMQHIRLLFDPYYGFEKEFTPICVNLVIISLLIGLIVNLPFLIELMKRIMKHNQDTYPI